MSSVFPSSYQSITNVVISSGVTSIGSSVFSGCSGLTSVTIPDSVTNIGSSAFSGCSGLTSVYISDLSAWCRISFDSYSANPLYSAHNLYLGNTLLTSVTIPDSVTSIGSFAFDGCSGLTSVTIPDSVTSIGSFAFDGCSGLTSVTIPDSVTSIGDSAFRFCDRLTSVYVPNEHPVRDNSFPSAAAIYRYAPKQEVTLEMAGGAAGVSSIGVKYGDCYGALPTPTRPGHSFSGWKYESLDVYEDTIVTALEDHTIVAQWTPNKYTVVFDANGGEGGTIMMVEHGASLSMPDLPTREEYNFVGWFTSESGGELFNCAGVVVTSDLVLYAHWNPIVWFYDVVDGKAVITGCSTSSDAIVIPSKVYGYPVEAVAARAFADCANLTGVVISDGVEIIAKRAFYNCSRLTTIEIPDSVVTIGAEAFSGCTGLTKMTIPDSVTTIGASAFGYCSNLKDITVPQCVCSSRISNAFTLTYQSITNVVISDGVTNIGTNAFYGCGGLLNVKIGSGVTEICSGAFRNCQVLTSVTIPNGVTNIGSSAFYGCVALSNITIPEMVEKIGSSAFYNCTSLTNVMFEGDAPTSVGNNAFLGISQDCHGWVHRASTGWKITLPGRWNNILLDYIQCVVTLNARGGTCAAESVRVAEGAAIGELPVPMKMNFDFTGWFTAPEGGSKVLPTTKVSRDTVVYAHWEAAALTYGEALDVGEEVVIATDAAIPWRPIRDAAAKVGDASARSGAVGDRASSWLSATVSGAGTMSFWCKVSCEHDEDGMFTWDRLMVYTNDVEIVEWRMDGETGWVERTLSFDGGANTVKWVYYKDKSDSNGQDCAWVDAVTWTSDGGDVVVDFGEDKSMVVSGEWIAEHETYIRSKGDDTVLALKSKAANGRLSIADCYLLGIDPEEPTEDFKITSFPMKADGSPDFDAIIFSPPQAKWNFQGAVPKLKGKVNLNDQWQDIPPDGNPSFRFFTIVVELP